MKTAASHSVAGYENAEKESRKKEGASGRRNRMEGKPHGTVEWLSDRPPARNL